MEDQHLWSEITNDSHVPKVGLLVYNRIFVKGLPDSASVGDIHQIFARYGNVREIKLITDRCGRSKGYGFVTFESKEEALKVLQLKNPIYINGKDIVVGPAVKKPSRKMQGSQYRSPHNYPTATPIYIMNPLHFLPTTSQYNGYYIPTPQPSFDLSRRTSFPYQPMNHSLSYPINSNYFHLTPPDTPLRTNDTPTIRLSDSFRESSFCSNTTEENFTPSNSFREDSTDIRNLNENSTVNQTVDDVTSGYESASEHPQFSNAQIHPSAFFNPIFYWAIPIQQS